MFTVGYYIKGQAKQFQSCASLREARAFMAALAENSDCEAYGLEK